MHRVARATGEHRRAWLAVGILVLLGMTLVAYIPALRGGFIWDDDDNVTENSTLRTWHGLARIWFDPLSTQQYYPLTHTSFWVQYRIWGLWPFPYHFANVLLHATVAVLLWFVLERLAVPGAWFAAAVFALHPVHVESVAWITERKNVLAGVFFLAAILTYVRAAGLDRAPGVNAAAAGPDAANRWWFAAAILLAVCALLAKSATSSLPAVLLVIVWWKKGRLTWRDVVPTLPMFVAGAAMGATTSWLEKYHVGATGQEWNLSFLGKVVAAGRVPWFYAAKLVWPANLTFIYPRWQIDPGQLWQDLFPIGTAAVLVGLFALRGRLGRGPFAAVSIFVLALAPASGFFNVFFMRYSFVQDHFQYFASMGLLALFAASITQASRRLAVVQPALAAAREAVPAVILATLGTLTWQQSRMYQDSETLYRTTLARNPAAWMAHYNLGHLLLERGKTDEALVQFFAALELRPDDDEIHSNLGVALGKAGKPAEAAAHFDRALELNPRSAVVHINYGSVLIDEGKVDAAVAQLQAALRLDPQSADAHCNLGVALRLQGRPNEAIAEHLAALRIDPDHVSAHINLGGMLFRQGKVAEAAAHFDRALRTNPRSVDAHLNLAQCFWSQGKQAAAIDQYRQTLALQPANADAANNLAWILATNPDAARRDGSEAVRLAELACQSTAFQNSGMLDTLAAADAEAGRFEDAVTTARRALELATAANESDRAQQIQRRLSLYEQHRPFRSVAP